MNKYISRGLYCALFVGGISVLNATSAHAMDTTGQDGALSGQQVEISLNAPIDLTRNAVSVVGDSRSEGPSDGTTVPSSGRNSTTFADDGVTSGDQIMSHVEAPIDLETNTVSIFGDPPAPGSSGTPARDGSQTAPTSMDGGDASFAANQASAEVAAPLTVNGNSLSVIGDSETTDTHGSGSPHSTSDVGAGGTGSTGPLPRSAEALAETQTSAESPSNRSVTGLSAAQVNDALWRASGDSQAVEVLASTGAGPVGYGAGALLAGLITVGAVLVARRQAMRE